MEKIINVFVKHKRDKNTGEIRNIHLTKDKNDNCYEIVFTQSCENRELLPTDKYAFILTTDTNYMSSSVKKRFVDNKEYKKNMLYIKKIVKIEEYIEPEFDASDFE